MWPITRETTYTEIEVETIKNIVKFLSKTNWWYVLCTYSCVCFTGSRRTENYQQTRASCLEIAIRCSRKDSPSLRRFPGGLIAHTPTFVCLSRFPVSCVTSSTLRVALSGGLILNVRKLMASVKYQFNTPGKHKMSLFIYVNEHGAKLLLAISISISQQEYHRWALQSIQFSWNEPAPSDVLSTEISLRSLFSHRY